MVFERRIVSAQDLLCTFKINQDKDRKSLSPRQAHSLWGQKGGGTDCRSRSCQMLKRVRAVPRLRAATTRYSGRGSRDPIPSPRHSCQSTTSPSTFVDGPLLMLATFWGARRTRPGVRFLLLRSRKTIALPLSICDCPISSHGPRGASPSIWFKMGKGQPGDG